MSLKGNEIIQSQGYSVTGVTNPGDGIDISANGNQVGGPDNADANDIVFLISGPA